MAEIADIRQRMGSIDNFCNFVFERMAMRDRIEAGEVSTDDPILLTKHFPNIDRQWDATTQWLIFNYYTPNVTNSNLWMAPIIARYFNKPATLQYLSIPDIADADELLLEWYPKVQWLNALGQHPVFNPFNPHAYMRFKYPNTGDAFLVLLRALIKNRLRFKSAIEESYSGEAIARILCLLPGMGQFIATEVIQDMFYTRLANEFKDKESFIFVSTSAKVGLALVFRRSIDMLIPKDVAQREVFMIQAKMAQRFNVDLTSWQVLRGLCLYQQYYLAMTEPQQVRNYIPGRQVNLWVPFLPEGYVNPD